MDEQSFAGLGEAGARRAPQPRMKPLGIHEVPDDADIAVVADDAMGLVPQVIGDRGDRVGLLQSEPRHRPVGRIGTDQRDVGAVQRSHDAESIATDHLARQERRDAVRHCVVGVDEVEFLADRDVREPARKRHLVRRELEQRIRGDVDLVKEQPGPRLVAHRRRIGDHVDFMSPRRHFGCEVGSDGAGAAERRITGDADPERSHHEREVFG